MPNGDITELDYHRFQAKLLDAQTASEADGVWVEVPPGYSVRSFQASQSSGPALEEGASDATVSIRVSNADVKPLNTVTGEETVGLTVTNPAGDQIESYRWVKATKVAGTTPVATTVRMVCNRR